MHEYDIKGSVHSRSGEDQQDQEKFGEKSQNDKGKLPIQVSQLKIEPNDEPPTISYCPPNK